MVGITRSEVIVDFLKRQKLQGLFQFYFSPICHDFATVEENQFPKNVDRTIQMKQTLGPAVMLIMGRVVLVLIWQVPVVEAGPKAKWFLDFARNPLVRRKTIILQTSPSCRKLQWFISPVEKP